MDKETAKIILDLIHERMNNLNEELIEAHRDKVSINAPGVCMPMGARDELIFLADEIEDLVNG
jgi:hypothetical protein